MSNFNPTARAYTKNDTMLFCHRMETAQTEGLPQPRRPSHLAPRTVGYRMTNYKTVGGWIECTLVQPRLNGCCRLEGSDGNNVCTPHVRQVQNVTIRCRTNITLPTCFKLGGDGCVNQSPDWYNGYSQGMDWNDYPPKNQVRTEHWPWKSLPNYAEFGISLFAVMGQKHILLWCLPVMNATARWNGTVSEQQTRKWSLLRWMPGLKSDFDMNGLRAMGLVSLQKQRIKNGLIYLSSIDILT